MNEMSTKYVIETFDALQLAVRRENLKTFEPFSPSEAEPGGFHAAWPHSAEGAAHFAAQVAERVAAEDYCVIQLFTGGDSSRGALQEGKSPLVKYRSMRKELDTAYLGQNYKCKAAWLDGLAEEKQELTSVLDHFDLMLSQLTKLMVPLASVALDFVPYSRTNAMLRMPYQNAGEESRLRPQEIDEEDIADGVLDEHVQFLKRRRLCMLLVCSSEGGELTFFPKDEDKDSMRFRTSQGQLIAFRHDRMSFSYRPDSDRDVVLQAWILCEPDDLQNLKLETENQAFKDEAIGLLAGPNTPEGPRIDTLGIGVMFPGGSDFADEAYWTACASGTDGVMKAPLSRFDIDIYYKASDEWTQGWTYTNHGGFVCADIYALDNKFFNIEEGEAYLMAPAQRCLLEKGYEAMFRSGHSKASLKNQRIGVFCGHSGDDWTCTPVFTYGNEDRHRDAFKSRIWSTLTGRVCHTFGLKGPQALIDTACSSALVAYGVGHTAQRTTDITQHSVGVGSSLGEALMMGANMMPGPGNFINLCGPHMLSTNGRCFTFDVSADGFERGEGCGAFFTRTQKMRTDDTTCTMIGACLNQDGRSASMTAPNGPAQQECIRGSMKEAGLRASEVTCAELHGTGTALGDPIEVGSLKGVMQDRSSVPLMQSSAKTHLGHLEACAGMAGVIKCMLMCNACTGSPNCHLFSLNPHLDITGYPTVIATEMSDFGANSGLSGVSSFGFGGANARADVFAMAVKGPHATGPMNLEKLDYITVTCPIDEGPMHYLDGKAVPLVSSVKYRRGPYHVDAIRDEFASYDYSSGHYNGKYLIHPPDEDYDEVPEDPIFIVGSWDCFTEPREMTAGDYDGSFTFVVPLGETRCERFQLQVDKDPARAIFPVAKNGSMRTRVVGPDASGEGLYWMLDARDDEVPAGTLFRITLQWGEQPTMRWERAAAAAAEEAAPTWWGAFRHAYYIEASWVGGIVEAMRDVSTPESPSTWEAKCRIGMSGTESFNFCRDNDVEQMIYPARDEGGEGVPACGPDEFCNNKRWTVHGMPGDELTVRLQVVDAHVTVSTTSTSGGSRTVHSLEGSNRHSYHVFGSWNDMRPLEMVADARVPGVFRCRGHVGFSGTEQFSIAMDADPDLILYPETAGSYPGDSIVRGPAAASQDQTFSVFALNPEAEFEIVYDRHAADKRKVVDINWITARCDFESMKAVAYHHISTSGGLFV